MRKQPRVTLGCGSYWLVDGRPTGYRGRDYYDYLLRVREKATEGGTDPPFVSEKVYGSDESGKSS